MTYSHHVPSFAQDNRDWLKRSLAKGGDFKKGMADIYVSRDDRFESLIVYDGEGKQLAKFTADENGAIITHDSSE